MRVREENPLSEVSALRISPEKSTKTCDDLAREKQDAVVLIDHYCCPLLPSQERVIMLLTDTQTDIVVEAAEIVVEGTVAQATSSFRRSS
jgi:hypothetical protein